MMPRRGTNWAAQALALLSFSYFSVSSLPVSDPLHHGLQLGPSDFPLPSEGCWFIEHMSSWCGHCKKFAPTWANFVDELEPWESRGLKLAQVECSSYGDLCTENGVSAYPTLLFFRDGKKEDRYQGSRTITEMKSWLENKLETSCISPPPKQDSSAIEDSTASSEVQQERVSKSQKFIPNPKGEIEYVTHENFEEWMSPERGSNFIAYKASWCGHCKKLAPIWAQVATSLKGQVNVLEMDCENPSGNKKICSREGVEGFPTLNFYNDGQRIEYRAGRNLQELVKFADKAQAATGKKEIANDAELTRVLAEENVFFLYFYSSDASPAEKTAIRNASRRLLADQTLIFHTTNPSLVADTGSSGSSLYVFKDGSPYPRKAVTLPHDSTVTVEKLTEIATNFVLENRFQTLSELSAQNFKSIMEAPDRPLVVLTVINEEEMGKDEVTSAKKDLFEIAQRWDIHRKRERSVAFAWIDGKKWSSWTKSLYGFQAGKESRTVIADHVDLLYWDLDASGNPVTGVKSDSIFRLLDNALDGKIKAKSSRSFLDRIAFVIGQNVLRLQIAASNHPFIAVVVFVGFLAGGFFMLKRVFDDEPEVVDYVQPSLKSQGYRKAD